MTLTDAARTIDRLVADLARATGRDEKIVRLAYGLDGERLETLMQADVAELAAPDRRVSGQPGQPGQASDADATAGRAA